MEDNEERYLYCFTLVFFFLMYNPVATNSVASAAAVPNGNSHYFGWALGFAEEVVNEVQQPQATCGVCDTFFSGGEGSDLLWCYCVG